MLRACMLLLFLGIMPVICSAQAGDAPKAYDLETLRTLLKDGTVAKVQVLHAPDSMLTRVAVNPQSLRALARATKTFDQNLAGTFDPVFSGIAVKYGDHCTNVRLGGLFYLGADLRWGVLFYDSQDREIAVLFVDKFGHDGCLDDTNVSFDAGVHGVDIATRLHEATGIPRG